jgi:superfamily I DNA and/or RNA helicase
LVRSNSFNNIGFLKTSNRVCVALSRAKHGLYIFGNSSCLVSGQKPLQLWVDVINYLKENKFIGDEIQVRCDHHGNIASIKTLEDFVKVPEGGCS